MKVLYLGSTEKKNLKKELNEKRKERKEDWSKSSEKEVGNEQFENKLLKWNLIIQSKCRWSIEKWMSGKLISLTF